MGIEHESLGHHTKRTSGVGFEPTTSGSRELGESTRPRCYAPFTDLINTRSRSRNFEDSISSFGETEPPRAKRTKSLSTLIDSKTDSEVCTTCIQLLEKFSDMQKDIDGLKGEIANLKKLPRYFTQETQTDAAVPEKEKTNTAKKSRTKRSQQPMKVKETREKPTPPTEETAERSATSCKNKIDPGLSMNRHSPHATPAIAASLMEVSPARQTFGNEEPGSNSTTTVASGSKDDDNIHWHQVVAGSKSKPHNPLVNRNQCIVIKGMPESSAEAPKKRIDHDMDLFHTYVKALLYLDEEMEVPVLKAFRMGQKKDSNEDSGQPRPIKFILKHEEQVKLLLSRKPHLRKNHSTVFFQRDYSPAEREKWRELMTELHRRSNAGQRNLRIVNGEIVTAQRSFLWRQPITICLSNRLTT